MRAMAVYPWRLVTDVSTASRQGGPDAEGDRVVITVRDVGPIATPVRRHSMDFLGRPEPFSMASLAIERWWRDAGAMGRVRGLARSRIARSPCASPTGHDVGHRRRRRRQPAGTRRPSRPGRPRPPRCRCGEAGIGGLALDAPPGRARQVVLRKPPGGGQRAAELGGAWRRTAARGPPPTTPITGRTTRATPRTTGNRVPTGEQHPRALSDEQQVEAAERGQHPGDGRERSRTHRLRGRGRPSSGSSPTVSPGRRRHLADGQQHTGHEPGAVERVVTQRQDLAGVAEHDLFVRHRSAQPHRVHGDAVDGRATGARQSAGGGVRRGGDRRRPREPPRSPGRCGPPCRSVRRPCRGGAVSTISTDAKCAAASRAKRISSTAPSAKLGATTTPRPGAASSQRAHLREPFVVEPARADDDVHAERERLLDVVPSRRRAGEVDDDLCTGSRGVCDRAVAVDASDELEVGGGLDRRDRSR